MTQSLYYFDWAATSPLCVEARSAMEPFLLAGTEGLVLGGANPNSLHSSGRVAFSALEDARARFAKSIGASRPSEIIFTSGATESNNAFLFGWVRAIKKQNKNAKPFIITSEIEHDSILEVARALKSFDCAVEFLKPNKFGVIENETLQACLETICEQQNCAQNLHQNNDQRSHYPNTQGASHNGARNNTQTNPPILVSIQAANSEIGVIQNIQTLAETAHTYGAVFHTDATQALGKIPFDAQNLNIDAASFSAHKICGPKGIGALYLKQRTPYEPLLFGGGQENKKRSGTQNVCGAVGFTAALQAALANAEEDTLRMKTFQQEIATSLQKHGAKLTLPYLNNETPVKVLPNIVHATIPSIDSETLVLKFSEKNIAVSGGSACSSASLEASHVLRAININDDLAKSALRISFGRLTTQAEVDFLIHSLPEVLQ